MADPNARAEGAVGDVIYNSQTQAVDAAFADVYTTVAQAVQAPQGFMERFNAALKTRSDLVANPVNPTPTEHMELYKRNYDMMANSTREGQKQFLRFNIADVIAKAQQMPAIVPFPGPDISSGQPPTSPEETPPTKGVRTFREGRDALLEAIARGEQGLPPEEPVPQTQLPVDVNKTVSWEEEVVANNYMHPAHNQGTSGTAVQALEALSKARNLVEQGQIYQTANQMMLADTLKELGFDIDNFYSTGNLPIAVESIVKEALPFSVIVDMARFGGLSRMEHYRKLDYAGRIQEANKLAGELKKAGVNPLAAIIVWDRITGVEEDSETYKKAEFVGTAVLDVVGSIFGAAQIPKYATRLNRAWILNRLRRMEKLSTAPGMLKAVGAVDTAAGVTATNIAATTTDLQAAANMDRITAVSTASPFNFLYQVIDPKVTTGLSKRTIRAIEDGRLLLNYRLEQAMNAPLTKSAGFLRPEERLKAEEALRAAMPEAAEVVETTPFGMKVRVTITPPVPPKTADEAQAAYTIAKQGYEQAVKDLDVAFGGQVHPSQATWVQGMQQRKAIFKAEMDQAKADLDLALKQPEVHERFVWYTRDMAEGTFNGTKEMNPLAEKTLSPESYLRNVDDLLVTERTEILAKEEGLHNLFKKVYEEALHGLSSGEVENLNHVLRYGDDTEQLFDGLKLQQGIDIPGVGTVKLSDKELAAYYKSRDTFDAMHTMRDYMKYRRLQFDGYDKEVPIILNGKDYRVFVKTGTISGRTADGKEYTYIPGGVDAVYDATINGARSLSKGGRAKLAQEIKEGKAWLGKAENPIRLGDDHFNYVVVHLDKVSGLKAGVLGKSNPGYIPRIYVDNPYVVRAERFIRVDGVKQKDPVLEVKGFFHNQAAAKKYADDQTIATKVKHYPDSDRELRMKDSAYRQKVDEAVFSGMYEESRTAQVPFGRLDSRNNIQFGETPRLAAVDAMDRYMNNLAWSFPMNEWRQGVIQRWLNTAKDYLVNPGDWRSEFKATSGLTSEQQFALTKTRDWIMSTLSIQNESERTLGRTMQYIAERMDNAKYGSAADYARLKLLYGAEHMDGIALLRQLTWRLTLGMGNMSQIVVQAANMATVFMLHPTLAPKIVRRIMALRAVATASPHQVGYESLIKIAARSAWMDPQEFRAMAHAWHSSGMAYTARASADVAASMRGMSTGGDLRRLGGVMDKILNIPYMETELWARMYGFMDAYVRFRKGDQLKKLASVDEVNLLVREAFRTSYNYTQINRAHWQERGFSLATQFLGPTARFYEELFVPMLSGQKKVSRFTKGERARLIVGNLVMYGALGVPAGMFMRDVVGGWLQDDQNPSGGGLSKEQAVLLTGGAMDFLAHEVASYLSGEDVYPAVAQRQALASGFDIMARNLGEQGSVYSLITGAFGAIPQRFMRAAHQLSVVQYPQFQQGWEYVDVLGGLDSVMTMAASWNNYKKRRLWEQANAILSNSLNPIKQLDPEKDSMMLSLQGFGLASYDSEWVRQLKDANEDASLDSDIDQTVNDVWLLTSNYIKDGYLDESKMRQYMIAKTLLRNNLATETARAEFDARWARRMMDKSTLMSRELDKFYDTLMKYNGAQDPTMPNVELLNDQAMTPMQQTELQPQEETNAD